ncbi:hypothetical protein IMCC1989_2524 [gamma proteobacterium IMCC1989]|nr:hypothetical protein IMCC1989_2524 [gamma proteobacterium IMCC1989]
MSETIELSYPVEVEGHKYSEIEIRRPVVSDMLVADRAKGNEAIKEIAMFSTLSELSPSVIEALDLSDYRKLQEAYQGFLS